MGKKRKRRVADADADEVPKGIAAVSPDFPLALSETPASNKKSIKKREASQKLQPDNVQPLENLDCTGVPNAADVTETDSKSPAQRKRKKGKQKHANDVSETEFRMPNQSPEAEDFQQGTQEPRAADIAASQPRKKRKKAKREVLVVENSQTGGSKEGKLSLQETFQELKLANASQPGTEANPQSNAEGDVEPQGHADANVDGTHAPSPSATIETPVLGGLQSAGPGQRKSKSQAHLRSKQEHFNSKQKGKGGQGKKVTAARPVLPWMRYPIEIEPEAKAAASDISEMHPALQAILCKGKFKELFPVQVAMWNALKGGYSQAHDFCLCAPTGSGKTLAYALPILQALSGRAGNLLGALIVLPTKELAIQVFEVFKKLSPAVDLWTMILASHNTLAAESATLRAYPVNVLIATPGRLMAHLHADPPLLKLHDLKFLVIDESDRLLKQSYQDWLPNVQAAINRPPAIQSQFGRVDDPLDESEDDCASEPSSDVVQERSEQPLRAHQISCERSRGYLRSRPANAHSSESSMKGRLALRNQGENDQPRVVKIVVSATLTQDPAKLERLQLHYPRYVAPAFSDQRYVLPKGLETFKLVGAAVDKAIILQAVLDDLKAKKTIIFTGSLPATHRLCAVLKELHGTDVVEYSSTVPKGKDAQAFASFKSGKARILVASDAVSRGLDVPGVQLIINYDAPAHSKTFVHRAGRTARAGQKGMVITLLSGEQVHHHKLMISKIEGASVKEYILPVGLVKSKRQEVQEAMSRAAEALDEDG